MRLGAQNLVVLAHAAADINQGVIPVLLPYFIAEHKISYAAAAGYVFATNAVATFAQPIIGHLADRKARPWLIPIAMMVVVLGVSGMALAGNYWLGFVSLLCCGMGVAVFHPEAAKLMNHLAGHRKATGMSLFGIGGQLGFSGGPILGTVLLYYFGLKGIALFLVPTTLMALAISLRLPELTSGYSLDEGRRGKTGTGVTGKDEWLAFTMVVGALLARSVVFYGLNTFLPLYWTEVLQQSKVMGGSVLAVFLIATMAGNFVGGRLADRFNYRIVIIGGFGMLSALLPLFALVRNQFGATALLLLIGLALSMPFGPMVALGQGYLPNRVGLASGITLGVAFSFGGLTTPILGWIGDHYGLPVTFWVLTLFPVLCVVQALMLPLKKSGAVKVPT